ncbi:MAG: transglycosylase SLT domain-containing protein [Pseudohongiellaceae bacterium]
MLIGLVPLLLSCAASPPRDVTDLCQIFEDRRSWYKAAQKAERRWDIPMSVNMAVIYQESGFRARARPERKRILFFIPWSRPSSAYGYAQALDGTWDEYEANSGNSRASRSNFADAIDFVSWYNANSVRINGIRPNNARDLYLAYHEGNGGYQRGTWRDKQWLLDAAAKVQGNADRFATQINSCHRDLNRGWLSRLLGW